MFENEEKKLAVGSTGEWNQFPKEMMGSDSFET